MADRLEHPLLASLNRLVPALRRCCLASLGGVVLASAATAGGPGIDGADLAATLCARCHDVAGNGPSPVSAAPPFRTIAARWPPSALAESLAEGITVKHAADSIMPEFELTPPEIESLITYLEELPDPETGQD